MRKKSDQGNFERSDPPEEGRRDYLKPVGALVAGLAVGGAAGWLSKPAERVTERITETVTRTVTAAITPTPTPTPTKPEEITAIMATLNIAEPLKAMLPDFEKETGIKVNLDMGDMSAYMTPKVLTSFAASVNPFDVLICNTYWQLPAWVAGDYLVHLNEYIERDRWFEENKDDYPWVVLAGQCIFEKEPRSGRRGIRLSLEDVWPYNPDKHYFVGLPVVGDVKFLMHRKDWFEEAGVEPYKTVDDVLRDAPKLTVDAQGLPLTDPNHGPTTRWGYVFYVPNTLGNPYLESFLPAWDARIVGDDFKPIPDDPKQLEILEWMQDVWNAKVVPDAAPTMGWVEQGEYFKKGKVASIETWCVVVGEVLKEVPELEPVLGYAPCPKKVYSGSTSAGWDASIPYNSAKKDSAWEFVKWVNSKEVQRKLVEAVGGIHGTGRYSIMDDPTVSAQVYQSSAKALLEAARIPLLIPEYGALMDTLTPIVAKCVYEGVSPRDTLNAINAAVEALLRGAGYYG